MIIYKKYYFDAAHYSPNFEDGHKNRRIHGHSYELKILLYGKIKKKSGWVMDLDELDPYLESVLKQLDHSLLNNINGLENPTCENIAKWIWKMLKKKIKNLHSIEIYRPRVGGCVYSG